MVYLKYEDFKWKGEGPFDRERVTLPKLLSPSLPDALLKKYGISQIDVSVLEGKIDRKRKLENINVIASNHKRSSSSASSVSSPRSLIFTNGSGKTTPATSVSSDSSTTPPNSPNQSANSEAKANSQSYTTKITNFANELKETAIKLYQDRNYNISILDFTQTYLLYILALRMKERECDFIEFKSDTARAKYLSRKRRDWSDVLSFGEKIVDNFSKVIDNHESRDLPIEYMNHMIGLACYINGFVQLHLSELFFEHINIIKERNKTKDNYELTLQMIKLIDKYQEIKGRSEKSIQMGEDRFGLFIIARCYSNLWNKSLTKYSQLNQNKLILPNDICINGQIIEFPKGSNYFLPISTHLWNLDNILNFGGHFIKEWCNQQHIKHSIIYQVF
ncbi:hypothetical protein CANINC_002897 [Pichia inconspicua]|uniref:Uncharacterized protein n=1 Tax=Pichia inconspicua TaxID=52247 RepID=A0A4T0X001_9ASCO|nr:hypothetical protein CANINC_002897 [[Candida] inconspicua]